jgi:hypothetical protein
VDNRKSIAPPAETTNLIPHEHVYELRGGPTFYAECACGEKLNRGNGVVCGSRAKVQAALLTSVRL